MGSTVSTPFMNQSEELPYVDDGTAQIVALPLVGGQVSVVFALPHGDLATYEAGLTAATPTPRAAGDDGRGPALAAEVRFTSPSFSLAAPLQAMGMKQAFDPGAAHFGACARARRTARTCTSPTCSRRR